MINRILWVHQKLGSWSFTHFFFCMWSYIYNLFCTCGLYILVGQCQWIWSRYLKVGFLNRPWNMRNTCIHMYLKWLGAHTKNIGSIKKIWWIKDFISFFYINYISKNIYLWQFPSPLNYFSKFKIFIPLPHFRVWQSVHIIHMCGLVYIYAFSRWSALHTCSSSDLNLGLSPKRKGDKRRPEWQP
jgi:hypothetical protein